MTTLSSTMGTIADRSRVIGIPRYISHAILPLVEKWVNCSGVEWTVNRLKSVKTDLIRIRAGDEPSSTWIKRSKNSKTFFGGPFGFLEKWMGTSSSNFRKGIQFIQMYTSFYSPVVTRQQKEKFVSSVLSSPVSLTEVEANRVNTVLNQGLRWSQYYTGKLLPRSGELPPAGPLLLMEPSPNKRAPMPSGKSIPEGEAIVDSVSFLFGSPSGTVHYHSYKKLYDPVLSGLEDVVQVAFGFNYPHAGGTIKVGRIGLIQEAGYKLRAVANPGRIFQRVLEPLGDFLFGILKDLPWDCTFDQTKAVVPLQNHLLLKKKVFCYDLSNATDLFPLSAQREVLDFLLPHSQYPQLFEDLARGQWFMPDEGWISWKVGQPLGLYPSFASFALTHGLVLLGLLNRPYAGEFYILGDDVVIIDERLAESYYQFMHMIGCKISAPKSIVSNRIAEFAGRLISSDEVIPLMKYRNISDESFVDLARALGPRSLWLMKPRQRQVLLALGPVPEFLGGLGWNPKGLPLKSRLSSWVFDDPQPITRSTGHTRLMVRNFLNSQTVNLVSSLIEEEGFSPSHTLQETSLDQRVQDLVRNKMGEALVPLSPLLGKNIDAVFNSNVDLPIETPEFKAKRPSTLDVWLRRLGILSSR